MGASKSSYFSDRHNEVAMKMKALAHPARIAIVEYLIRVNACICGDIVNEVPLSQPTVSQHLKELKTAGIIKGTVEGNAICYCIDETAINDLKNYFYNISEQLKDKQDACCER